MRTYADTIDKTPSHEDFESFWLKICNRKKNFNHNVSWLNAVKCECCTNIYKRTDGINSEIFTIAVGKLEKWGGT